jgi:hypothetical protein
VDVLFKGISSVPGYQPYKQPSYVFVDDLELPVYDYETIAKATEDFSTENKLGEGGFGPIY